MCGLPGSGNKFIGALVVAAGLDWILYHGEGDDEAAKRLVHNHRLLERPWGYAVMPVRHNPFRMANNRGPDYDTQREWTQRVLWTLGNIRVPVKMVSYEAMFLYPESFKHDLLTTLGVSTDIEWPSKPQDMNAKYLPNG